MKHVHCDLIKAWADGAKIQYFSLLSGTWVDLDGEPLWKKDTKYRIKPEVMKYRVAIFLYGSNTTFSANSEKQAKDWQQNSHFVKWLTDWIEYEVETATK